MFKKSVCAITIAVLSLSAAPMKLTYDVYSKSPSYKEFRVPLPNVNASGYDNLAFRVKGDPKAGYTTVFKVQLQNAAKQTGDYYVTSIGDQWQETVIPLSEFKGMTDLSNLTEFVVVFESRMVSNKIGVIYIDNIRLTRNK